MKKNFILAAIALALVACGQQWQMVRLYANNYPERLYLGICSQAPQSDECISTFEQLSLTTDNVGDFRMGE